MPANFAQDIAADASLAQMRTLGRYFPLDIITSAINPLYQFC
jgi:hypothetical protein